MFDQRRANNSSNRMAAARSVNGEEVADELEDPQPHAAEPEVVVEEPYGGSQYSSDEYEAEIVGDSNDYGNDDEWNRAMRDHDPQTAEFMRGMQEDAPFGIADHVDNIEDIDTEYDLSLDFQNLLVLSRSPTEVLSYVGTPGQTGTT